MNIAFNDLTIKNRNNYIKIFKNFLNSGKFVNGKNVFEFEKQFSKKFNFKYGIGCNSGTDAIEVALRFLKKKIMRLLLQFRIQLQQLFLQF